MGIRGANKFHYIEKVIKFILYYYISILLLQSINVENSHEYNTDSNSKSIKRLI